MSTLCSKVKVCLLLYLYFINPYDEITSLDLLIEILSTGDNYSHSQLAVPDKPFHVPGMLTIVPS